MKDIIDRLDDAATEIFLNYTIKERAKISPQMCYLAGALGSDVFHEYRRRIRRDFDNNPVLESLRWNSEFDVVDNYNAYSMTLISKIVGGYFSIATPLDLEKMVQAEIRYCKNNKHRFDGLPKAIEDLRAGRIKECFIEPSESENDGLIGLDGFCESGLVLFSMGGPNLYLQRKLVEQLKSTGFCPEKDFPVIIPYAGLDLEKDCIAEHGLMFKVTKDLCLIGGCDGLRANRFGLGIRFTDLDRNGLPVRDAGGVREVITSDNGLVRLCSRERNIYCNRHDLTEPYVISRIVLVKKEEE